MARKLVGIENDGIKTRLVFESDGKYEYDDAPLGFRSMNSLTEQVSS